MLAALGHEPAPIDTLHYRTGIAPAPLQAELLALQLAGRIRRLADGRFARCRDGTAGVS